jgi:hypothetical protein
MEMADKLTKTVRKARRVGLMNKIEAIKIVREAYPEAGLKCAKDFYEMVTGEWEHVPATSMAACWCIEHWCDRLQCRCPLLDVWCSACDRPITGLTFEQRKEHYNECNGGIVAAAGAAKAPKQDESVQTEGLVVGAGCGCKPSAMKKDCADPWHRAAWWIGQPGNYAKLMTWIEAGMPDDESIPFAKRKGEWLGVEPK